MTDLQRRIIGPQISFLERSITQPQLIDTWIPCHVSICSQDGIIIALTFEIERKKKIQGHMKPLAAAKAKSRSILLILGGHLDFLGLA
jgi:hypothetical protein